MSFVKKTAGKPPKTDEPPVEGGNAPEKETLEKKPQIPKKGGFKGAASRRGKKASMP